MQAFWAAAPGEEMTLLAYRLQLARVDRIAPVVAGAVGDGADLRLVRLAVGRGRSSSSRAQNRFTISRLGF